MTIDNQDLIKETDQTLIGPNQSVFNTERPKHFDIKNLSFLKKKAPEFSEYIDRAISERSVAKSLNKNHKKEKYILNISRHYRKQNLITVDSV